MLYCYMIAGRVDNFVDEYRTEAAGRNIGDHGWIMV